MSTTTLLSVSWFGDHERTLATAIATTSNGLGGALGYLIAPYVVQEWNIQVLMIGMAVLGALSLLGALLYFPNAPPTPPSSAAKEDKGDSNPFLSDLKILFTYCRLTPGMSSSGWWR